MAAPLLAGASALIGHARWAQATPGWAEPPHLWIGAVGESGNGKSPGADCLMRDVLPEIERRMHGDYPDQLRRWRATVEFEKAAVGRWREEVRKAEKAGASAPLPPIETAGPEPQVPRLRQNDVTIEKVAHLLAATASKGLLIVRDELTGWITGMNTYNDAGRAFWVDGAVAASSNAREIHARAAGDIVQAKTWLERARYLAPDRPELAFLTCVTLIELGEGVAPSILEDLSLRFPDFVARGSRFRKALSSACGSTRCKCFQQ